MRRAAEHCVAHDASYHAAFVVRFFGPKNERRLNETNVKEPGGSRSATDFRSASPLDTARAFVETLAALKKQKRGSGVRETDFLQTKYVAATATRVRSAAFAAGDDENGHIGAGTLAREARRRRRRRRDAGGHIRRRGVSGDVRVGATRKKRFH